jgi:putative ABC transport system substrate-binding protein
MRRREVIALVGCGLAGAWSALAHAQQGVRRIGMLMGIANDAEGQRRVAAFRQGLQALGWKDDGNVRFEYRWGSGDIEKIRTDARQLIATGPDLILGNSTLAARVAKEETQAIPIVFVQVADPVREGLVPSLARPGGNVTGFTSFEYAMGGKWFEILKEISPAISRVGILTNPQDSNVPGFLRAIEPVAAALHVQTTVIDSRTAQEIERSIEAFAADPKGGGLVVLPTPSNNLHRALIISLAARHRLPTTYFFRFFVTEGGLVSYSFDSIDPFRRAASYADRILKGEKPADLPVQAPVKYELVFNLKAARAIGLSVPPSFLLRADEVIE